jgi:transposase
MYQLHTEKQRKYFAEAIRLHYEEGYGEDRIAKILPIGHTTVSRWIAIFAKEKGKDAMANNRHKRRDISEMHNQGTEVQKLQKRIKELEAELLAAEIKAEAYDELINVAEAKFRIPIRKKAGAKQ